jgi:uncharacterized alpha-E superfamily protein
VTGEATGAFNEGNQTRLEHELFAALTATGRQGNLRDLVRQLRRTLWLVRDRLSLDAWRFLSLLERRLPGAGGAPSLDANSAMALLDELLLPLSAFSGLAGESTTRGPGWRFLDMGRRVERALFTTTLLRRTLCQADKREPRVMQILLEVADSTMTYRSRYLSVLQLPPLLDLLVADETNPRSIAFQAASLMGHVEELLSGTTRAGLEPEQRLATSILTRIRLADVTELAEVRGSGARRRLAALLDGLEADLPELSNVLSHRYFSHSQTVRQRHGAGL